MLNLLSPSKVITLYFLLNYKPSSSSSRRQSRCHRRRHHHYRRCHRLFSHYLRSYRHYLGHMYVHSLSSSGSSCFELVNVFNIRRRSTILDLIQPFLFVLASASSSLPGCCEVRDTAVHQIVSIRKTRRDLF